MKSFHCDCDHSPTLFFESSVCTRCRRPVGFCPDQRQMRSFEIAGDGLWRSAGGARYRPCGNRLDHEVCNWMIAPADDSALCLACRFNEMIPDLSVADNRRYWARLEAAKRRALYTVLGLGLPLASATAEGELRLRFRFLADRAPESEFTEPLPNQAPVYTGHEHGEITINLAEADEVARTREREQLGERYRTLLGHFRHEIGHFYWELLIAPDARRLQRFREVFGDERRDYDAAREAHYSQAEDGGGHDTISEYAAMHPWEDWAETWAHYLHMIDSLETAAAHELRIGARDYTTLRLPLETSGPVSDPQTLVAAWIELALVLNSQNRSLGLRDAYPFMLTAAVREKLGWVHEVLQACRQWPNPATGAGAAA